MKVKTTHRPKTSKKVKNDGNFNPKEPRLMKNATHSKQSKRHY